MYRWWLIVVLLLMTLEQVTAHDFYPPECCSGKDCAPLSEGRVAATPGGYMIDGIFFVLEKQTRVSPDRRYHGCFPNPDMLLCFYAPKPSM